MSSTATNSSYDEHDKAAAKDNVRRVFYHLGLCPTQRPQPDDPPPTREELEWAIKTLNEFVEEMLTCREKATRLQRERDDNRKEYLNRTIAHLEGQQQDDTADPTKEELEWAGSAIMEGLDSEVQLLQAKFFFLLGCQFVRDNIADSEL